MPEKVFAISKVASDEVTTNFTFESPDADRGASGSPVLSVGSGGLYLSGVMFRGKETGTTQLALSHSVCQKAFDTTIGLIDKSQTAQAYHALAGVLSEIEQVERCQGVFTDLVGKLEEGAEKEKLEIILHFPFLPVITPTRTKESREQTQETDDFVEKAKQWRFVSRVPEDVREVGREVVNYISNRSEACPPATFTKFRNGEGYLPRCGKDKVYYEAQVGQDREGKRGKRRVVVLVANDDKVEAMYYTPSHYGPEHKDDVSKKARKLSFFKFR